MKKKQRGGGLWEKREFFWKILYGEPWALSNTPFYDGG